MMYVLKVCRFLQRYGESDEGRRKGTKNDSQIRNLGVDTRFESYFEAFFTDYAIPSASFP